MKETTEKKIVYETDETGETKTIISYKLNLTQADIKYFIKFRTTKPRKNATDEQIRLDNIKLEFLKQLNFSIETIEYPY
jgi:hypothetical protein